MSLSEASQHKKSDKVKTFLKKNFSLKNNLWRLVFFGLGLAVILFTSLVMEIWAFNQSKASYGSPNNFLWITFTLNSGIAFSGLADSPAAIYVIQVIVLLILIGFFIFLVKKYYLMFMSLAMCGGTYNLIDRMVPKAIPWPVVGADKEYNKVLDYFQFYGKSAVFNFSDVWILTGIIGFCVLLLIFTIISVVKDSKKNKKKQEQRAPDSGVSNEQH